MDQCVFDFEYILMAPVEQKSVKILLASSDFLSSFKIYFIFQLDYAITGRENGSLFVC
jgi:hypothetical protein